MTIEIKRNTNRITIVLEGRLDTITAPALEKTIGDSVEIKDNLVLDLKGLEYISSAGLRVILKAQKTMNIQGAMKLTNVNDDIMEVFDITGFLDILTVE